MSLQDPFKPGQLLTAARLEEMRQQIVALQGPTSQGVSSGSSSASASPVPTHAGTGRLKTWVSAVWDEPTKTYTTLGSAEVYVILDKVQNEDRPILNFVHHFTDDVAPGSPVSWIGPKLLIGSGGIGLTECGNIDINTTGGLHFRMDCGNTLSPWQSIPASFCEDGGIVVAAVYPPTGGIS